MVEVVGWGKTKNGRRLREATPCVVVSSSRPRFDELPIHSPFSFACVQVLRPPGLIVFFFSKKKKKKSLFIFYFLPSSQSDRVQSCSRRIVVFNKSYSSFLISSPLLFEQKCYGYCSRRHKKTKKKKFLAQTIFPTVSCACARVKQCVRSFVSDWKKKNWRKLWVVLWVSYHIHIDRWIDIHLFCVSQWLQSKKKSTKKKNKKKRVSNVFP